jgi:hypothetical protein
VGVLELSRKVNGRLHHHPQQSEQSAHNSEESPRVSEQFTEKGRSDRHLVGARDGHEVKRPLEEEHYLVCASVDGPARRRAWPGLKVSATQLNAAFSDR